MVDLLEINAAINKRIKETLKGTVFETVPFLDEDLQEGEIKRPSFKVMLEDSKAGKFNADLKESNTTVRIYFFAKDRYKPKIENLKVRNLINNAFLEDIKVNDSFYISIEEVEAVITDGVLVCSIDIPTLEEIPDNTEYEPLEELELNINQY